MLERQGRDEDDVVQPTDDVLEVVVVEYSQPSR
jgi:hypothetical protein